MTYRFGFGFGRSAKRRAGPPSGYAFVTSTTADGRRVPVTTTNELGVRVYLVARIS